jgi:hypothetical protein
MVETTEATYRMSRLASYARPVGPTIRAAGSVRVRFGSRRVRPLAAAHGEREIKPAVMVEVPCRQRPNRVAAITQAKDPRG